MIRTKRGGARVLFPFLLVDALKGGLISNLFNAELLIRTKIPSAMRMRNLIARSGGVMVLGDFNTHLGSLGGISRRGCGDSNVQGVLVSDMVARCHLSAISLCSVSSGPMYTYVS